MTVYTHDEITFRSAFEADDSLKRFGPNALSMFVLAIYLHLEDLDGFAFDSINEGGDDKKLDICNYNVENGHLIIVQSYLSKTWYKKAAPSDKASDLSSASAWLLSSKPDDIPDQLKDKAIEIRKALENGEIKHVEILYIHNCYESINAQQELETVVHGVRDIVKAICGEGIICPNVSCQEMGLNTIEDIYRARDSEILIDQWLDVPLDSFDSFIEESGEAWKAILTTVPANWIRGLHEDFGDRLFSANFREYLGYSKREGNINYQILSTAKNESGNFWAYNNGITALTFQLDMKSEDNPPRIRGISIINGAQTTGALGQATIDDIKDAKVLMRIVECGSPEIVDKIIRYNNTQNDIKPFDMRSNDSTQRKIRDQFDAYGIEYVHRRSALRTPRSAITAARIAPELCAFHGEPQTSYRNGKKIFSDEEIYASTFPINIKVEHIFLVHSLSLAINEIKGELKNKVAQGVAKDLEVKEEKLLKYSATKHFLFYMAGRLAEEIMNTRIPNLFEWKCQSKFIRRHSYLFTEAWVESIRALLPHLVQLMEQQGDDAFYEIPRSRSDSEKTVTQLVAMVASLQDSLGNLMFDKLRKCTTL